jgi:hypothetical protein
VWFAQVLPSAQSLGMTLTICGGYKPEYRVVYEALLLLRKWALVLLAFYVRDAVTATLASLLVTCVIWAAYLRWRPYAVGNSYTLTFVSHICVVALSVGIDCFGCVRLLCFVTAECVVMSRWSCYCKQATLLHRGRSPRFSPCGLWVFCSPQLHCCCKQG